MRERSLAAPGNLAGWLLASRQLWHRTVPSSVVDLTHIQPLLCLDQDDMQGIAPNLDIPNFNPEPPTYAIRFCPIPGYESILGLANEDGNIAFHDTDKVVPRIPLSGLPAHNNAIFDFTWNLTNPKNLVTVSGDQKCRLWDMGQADLVKLNELHGHSRSVKCVEWRLGSASEFATGARDNNIIVWDTRRNNTSHQDNIIRSAQGNLSSRAAATPATPSPRGKQRRTAATTASSSSSSSSSHPTSAAPACSVTGLAWQDQNTIVSIGDNDGIVKVWDMRKNYSLYRNNPIPKLEISYPGSSSTQGYTSLMLDPSSSYAYVSCMDGNIYKFHILTGLQRPVADYRGAKISNFFIKSSLSPCGRYLVSGSSDNKAYIWNTDSPGDPIATLGPQEAEVTCVAWKRKGTVLATCSDDMRHRIWRPQRCEDSLLIRGRVDMTGKRCPRPLPLTALSPVKSAPHTTTPSARLTAASSRLAGRHTTPTSGRAAGSASKLRTPSITSFLTPKAAAVLAAAGQRTPTRSGGGGGGGGSMAQSSAAGRNETTPVSQLKQGAGGGRGTKRRLTKVLPSSPNSEIGDRRNNADDDDDGGKRARTSGGVGNDIRPLLLFSPDHHCTFSPASYRSPNKNSPSGDDNNGASRQAAGRCTPKFIPSPFKEAPPHTTSPTTTTTTSSLSSRVEATESPARRPDLRRPLQPVVVTSPTANLPNIVRDGRWAVMSSPRGGTAPPEGGRLQQPARGKKLDWLTTYCKQKKRGDGPPGVKLKNPPTRQAKKIRKKD